MTYQVLARKWRPQDFSSLIGQQPIVTALRNGLTDNRIAQAYLFSGIRGVGKTTAARVLAKALNCERRPDAEGASADPCNECPTCRDITTGNDIDFVEVDAATYSKVEQVRDLTESLRYGPARDRYKVVVLDEVHRLSRQAFDALLKIVEEPPAHLVFIFATTEIDAVPATILSRCQEFQFRRVPVPVLASHLQQISEAESIQVSDAALRLIARAGEGSVRDSVALLDQLSVYGSGEIRDEDAKNLLGGLDTAIFLRLLEAILSGDGATISAIVSDIEASGWDPYNVYGQFLTFARDALQLALGSQPESIDLPREEAESLAGLVSSAGYENLLRVIHLLLESEATVRASEFGNLAVQIAWLRAAELPKLTRVEDLLAGREAPPAASPGTGAASRQAPAPKQMRRSAPSEAPRSASRSADRRSPEAQDAKPQDAKPQDAKPQDAKPQDAKPQDAETQDPGLLDADAQPAAPSVAVTDSADHEKLPSFLELLKTRSPSLAALLNGQRDDLDFSAGKLRIPRGDDHLAGALKRPHNRDTFEQLLGEVWGQGTGWGWSASRTPAAAEGQEDAAQADTSDPLREVRNDPTVQAVLEVFDGSKIQRIQTRQQGDT